MDKQTITKPTDRPVDLGVSRRALSFARHIDRLTEGTYTIVFHKRMIENWSLEIDRTEKVRRVELKK